ALSEDGRFAAFKAGQTNQFYVYRFDLATRARQLINTNATETDALSISQDGGFIAYESDSEVYVWNAETELSSLESKHLNADTGVSRAPVLSPDGRQLGFISEATNLVTPALSDGAFRLYIRDRVLGVTTLASVALDAQPAAVNHYMIPAIS